MLPGKLVKGVKKMCDEITKEDVDEMMNGTKELPEELRGKLLEELEEENKDLESKKK